MTRHHEGLRWKSSRRRHDAFLPHERWQVRAVCTSCRWSSSCKLSGWADRSRWNGQSGDVLWACGKNRATHFCGSRCEERNQGQNMEMFNVLPLEREQQRSVDQAWMRLYLNSRNKPWKCQGCSLHRNEWQFSDLIHRYNSLPFVSSGAIQDARRFGFAGLWSKKITAVDLSQEG